MREREWVSEYIIIETLTNQKLTQKHTLFLFNTFDVGVGVREKEGVHGNHEPCCVRARQYYFRAFPDDGEINTKKSRHQ